MDNKMENEMETGGIVYMHIHVLNDGRKCGDSHFIGGSTTRLVPKC